jgi:hypothetical protein
MAEVEVLMRQMLYGLTIVHRRQQQVLFTSSLICGTNTVGLTKTHLTQSRGRPTQLIFNSKLWQIHAHYISLKVVVDPCNLHFTQSHGRPMHHTSPFKVVADL